MDVLINGRELKRAGVFGRLLEELEPDADLANARMQGLYAITRKLLAIPGVRGADLCGSMKKGTDSADFRTDINVLVSMQIPSNLRGSTLKQMYQKNMSLLILGLQAEGIEFIQTVDLRKHIPECFDVIICCRHRSLNYGLLLTTIGMDCKQVYSRLCVQHAQYIASVPRSLKDAIRLAKWWFRSIVPVATTFHSFLIELLVIHSVGRIDPSAAGASYEVFISFLTLLTSRTPQVISWDWPQNKWQIFQNRRGKSNRIVVLEPCEADCDVGEGTDEACWRNAAAAAGQSLRLLSRDEAAIADVAKFDSEGRSRSSSNAAETERVRPMSPQPSFRQIKTTRPQPPQTPQTPQTPRNLDRDGVVPYSLLAPEPVQPRLSLVSTETRGSSVSEWAECAPPPKQDSPVTRPKSVIKLFSNYKPGSVRVLFVGAGTHSGSLAVAKICGIVKSKKSDPPTWCSTEDAPNEKGRNSEWMRTKKATTAQLMSLGIWVSEGVSPKRLKKSLTNAGCPQKKFEIMIWMLPYPSRNSLVHPAGDMLEIMWSNVRSFLESSRNFLPRTLTGSYDKESFVAVLLRSSSHIHKDYWCPELDLDNQWRFRLCEVLPCDADELFQYGYSPEVEIADDIADRSADQSRDQYVFLIWRPSMDGDGSDQVSRSSEQTTASSVMVGAGARSLSDRGGEKVASVKKAYLQLNRGNRKDATPPSPDFFGGGRKTVRHPSLINIETSPRPRKSDPGLFSHRSQSPQTQQGHREEAAQARGEVVVTTRRSRSSRSSEVGRLASVTRGNSGPRPSSVPLPLPVYGQAGRGHRPTFDSDRSTPASPPSPRRLYLNRERDGSPLDSDRSTPAAPPSPRRLYLNRERDGSPHNVDEKQRSPQAASAKPTPDHANSTTIRRFEVVDRPTSRAGAFGQSSTVSDASGKPAASAKPALEHANISSFRRFEVVDRPTSRAGAFRQHSGRVSDSSGRTRLNSSSGKLREVRREASGRTRSNSSLKGRKSEEVDVAALPSGNSRSSRQVDVAALPSGNSRSSRNDKRNSNQETSWRSMMKPRRSSLPRGHSSPLNREERPSLLKGHSSPLNREGRPSLLKGHSSPLNRERRSSLLKGHSSPLNREERSLPEPDKLNRVTGEKPMKDMECMLCLFGELRIDNKKPDMVREKIRPGHPKKAKKFPAKRREPVGDKRKEVAKNVITRSKPGGLNSGLLDLNPPSPPPAESPRS